MKQLTNYGFQGMADGGLYGYTSKERGMMKSNGVLR